MNQTLRIFLCLGLGVGLSLVIAGCGGPHPVTVTGRLTHAGQPFIAGPKGRFQMRLYPYPNVVEGTPYRSLGAEVNSDGTFIVQKVPLGQYLVTVQLLDPTPFNDLLKGAFSKERSKILIDVTGTEPMNIDVPETESN
jgi:hypothetical protein